MTRNVFLVAAADGDVPVRGAHREGDGAPCGRLFYPAGPTAAYDRLGRAREGERVTRVCLLGADDVDLRAQLLAYETAREALSPYALETPYENTVCVETISLGAAVSLCNDLDWYLVRLADAAIVLEPSVSEDEWLSRDLATAIRNDDLDPEATGDLLKIYGVREPEPSDGETEPGTPRLTEPMFARRVSGTVPEYDLHEVEDTLVVRVTEAEFG